MENYLPNVCYRDKPLKIEGIVIHYFSCINVQPKDPYNSQSCWDLMLDLNLPKADRRRFVNKHGDPANRMYASAHCFISRGGELILTVPADKQAYHAGRSHYNGRSNWNGLSYGIELIGSADSGFTSKQYETLAKHCFNLMTEHKFTMDMIVGHEDVSPGRKKDPGIATGNFELLRLQQDIVELHAKAAETP